METKSVNLPTELWTWLQEQADLDKRSVSNWLLVKLEQMKKEKENGN